MAGTAGKPESRRVTEKIGIVGAGIVGLAVARELATTRGAEVTVLEKEGRVAAHQAGHNSGVAHADQLPARRWDRPHEEGIQAAQDGHGRDE
jgi:glycine/D-amino acid oxidase-like deaminating enzyme